MKLLFLIILILACESSSVKSPTNDVITSENPKTLSERKVAFHITQAENNNYKTEFLRCKSIGATTTALTFLWDAIESGNTFNLDNIKFMDQFFPAYNTSVSMCISPISYINKGFPDDIKDSSFSDSIVIDRFKSLLDSVYYYSRNTSFTSIIIGNEINLYFDSNPSEYDEFILFYNEIYEYCKTLWPSVPVGTESTLKGYKENYNKLIELNKKSDIVVLSYYPIDEKFKLLPISSIKNDIRYILDLFPTKNLFIEETGVPSSEKNGSSERIQQEFINELFSVWDSYNTRINHMGFLWLTDLSDELTNTYLNSYNMTASPNSEAFKSYLQTTAFRTYHGIGKNKLAFKQLSYELEIRAN